jgi:broad specificity phosphatase PhoE
MGTLYLVRHGQASFGADDYDNLSDLGMRQSQRLGEYFKAKGLRFEAVLHGTLRRQIQTFEGIASGMQMQTTALQWPGLNEYDSEAVIRAIHPEPLSKERTPETYRHHFGLLRKGLAAWMQGQAQPQGMPSYADFVRGVTSALDHVRQTTQGNVLIVSSGGPISTAVGQVLGTAPEVTIELNLRIRNSSVTEFAFTPKRHMLVAYNALPHLEHPDYAHWETYS